MEKWLPADHTKTKDEAEVGHEDEEANQQQAEAAEDLVPGDGVEGQVLGVSLEQGVVTWPVLNPGGGSSERRHHAVSAAVLQSVSWGNKVTIVGIAPSLTNFPYIQHFCRILFSQIGYSSCCIIIPFQVKYPIFLLLLSSKTKLSQFSVENWFSFCSQKFTKMHVFDNLLNLMHFMIGKLK